MNIEIVFSHIAQRHLFVGKVQILLMLNVLNKLDSEFKVHVLFRSAPSSLLYGDDCFSSLPKPLQTASVGSHLISACSKD